MATFTATINKGVTVDDSVFMIQWDNLANSGDLGDPQSFPAYSDKTFIVTGTFAGSAVVAIEGSNDGLNWVTLSNRQGSAMTFSAAGMNTSQDRPIYVRPRLTAGTAATIRVTCAAHRVDLAGKAV